MAKPRSSNPPLTAFGRLLASLRGRRSTRLVSELLRAAGAKLSSSTLTQYEKGYVWAPDPVVLRELSRIYRVEHDALVDGLKRNRLDPGLPTIQLESGAALLTPEDSAVVDRWGRLSAADKRRISELLDRLLGVARGEPEFRQWDGTERRRG